MPDRCGWMWEGADRQCVLGAGHNDLHKWELEEDMLSRTSAYEQDLADYEEGIQKMPPMSSNSW